MYGALVKQARLAKGWTRHDLARLYGEFFHETIISEDTINWKEIFAFCEGVGKTEWYVVEHETSKDPIDAIKRNYAALQKFGKV